MTIFTSPSFPNSDTHAKNVAEKMHPRRRKSKINAKYKQVEDTFTETLKSISDVALDALHISRKPPADKLHGKEYRAQAIFDCRLYFPPSALHYLERAIRYRDITSWYCKLHLPYPPDEAPGNPKKEEANCQAENDTASHIHYTETLQEICTQLWRCANTPITGSPLPNNTFCEWFFLENELEDIFDAQEAYLQQRELRLQQEPAPREVRKQEDDIAHMSSIGNWRSGRTYGQSRPVEVKPQPAMKPKFDFYGPCRYACLSTEEEAS